MPEVYEGDIQETPVSKTEDEDKLISSLFEYIDPQHNPWRDSYLQEMKDWANFKELRQWSGSDETLLQNLDVPAVPIDRINRGLDTIEGIRNNTGSKKKIVKRELGDDRIAQVLDKVGQQVEYSGDFESTYDDVFFNMRDFGLGVFKCGFDVQALGGEGEIWIDSVDVENFWYSKCRKKTLDDITWACHRQMMYWEDAIQINPDKAGELKGLKSLQTEEWEKIKGNSVKATQSNVDYGSGSASGEGAYAYPNQVSIWEFWVLRRVPYVKVGYIQSVETVDPLGNINTVATPGIKMEKLPYEPQGDEQELAKTVINEWHQYIIATGEDKKGGILLKHSVDDDHPFVGECADKKKSGQPRGYIELVIPHQRRINLSWAQKIAFNNKAIKSPITLQGQTGAVKIDDLIQQSRLGAVMILPTGVSAVQMNQIPGVDLQAIEEGNVARSDMDFAAAATEEALRGVSDSGSSGIKVSLKQNAAVTPLSKWVKAEQRAKMVLWRKILRLIIKNFRPERMLRILGQEDFLRLVVGPLGPEGQPMLPPVQFNLDAVNYDVVVEDQSVSDFNKQQSFNATEALAAGGVLFTDDFRIKNAPIRNVDEALRSNEQARQDMIKMLMMQVEMLQSQASNAVTGKNAPQTGRRSMLGGQSPNSPLG